jgi:DNA modification methylase
MTNNDAYMTDEANGHGWTFWLGDSGERTAEVPADSIDLSIYSPPFESLYTYSASPRDMGNALDRADFFAQYGYMIRENLRITKPGRLAAVHVQQTTKLKSRDGYIGMVDFRGDVIKAYESEGWIYWGEATIDKDPQAQAIRTKAQQLMFVTKNRDSTMIRPALADYALIFKKPGDNAVPVKGTFTNEEWIEWARPVWLGIKEGDTLNARIARESDDERHLTPLQLGFIDRLVRMYSNPGETVFSMFGGVGSELYQSVKLGRRAFGIELKASYWATGCEYLAQLESEMSEPDLFDGIEIA